MSKHVAMIFYVNGGNYLQDVLFPTENHHLGMVFKVLPQMDIPLSNVSEHIGDQQQIPWEASTPFSWYYLRPKMPSFCAHASLPKRKDRQAEWLTPEVAWSSWWQKRTFWSGNWLKNQSATWAICTMAGNPSHMPNQASPSGRIIALSPSLSGENAAWWNSLKLLQFQRHRHKPLIALLVPLCSDLAIHANTDEPKKKTRENLPSFPYSLTDLIHYSL